MNSIIKFYPVGNGDTVLITLSDHTTIMIDVKVDNDAPDNKEKFDVKKDLLKSLMIDEDGRRHLDAFILTHPDCDHCSGFKDTFFCDDPVNYDKDAEKRNAIIIDELWFSDTLFDRFKEPLSEAAKNFKKEAKRRKDLYKEDPERSKVAGNRLRIIDFKDDPRDKGFEELITEPGTATNVINAGAKIDFSIFVHAPFKTPTEDSQDRNETSVIMQFRFGAANDPMAALALFAGDADYNRFKRLLDERDDETILWDLLLAPHHCSWTFFNMTPQEEYPDAQESAIEFLGKQRGKGIIVSSCKEIIDDDDNPPHHAAKEEYCNNIDGDDFYCTGDTPLQPLLFSVTRNGFKPEPVKEKTDNPIPAITSTPKTYG